MYKYVKKTKITYLFKLINFIMMYTTEYEIEINN